MSPERADLHLTLAPMPVNLLPFCFAAVLCTVSVFDNGTFERVVHSVTTDTAPFSSSTIAPARVFWGSPDWSRLHDFLSWLDEPYFWFMDTELIANSTKSKSCLDAARGAHTLPPNTDFLCKAITAALCSGMLAVFQLSAWRRGIKTGKLATKGCRSKRSLPDINLHCKTEGTQCT